MEVYDYLPSNISALEKEQYAAILAAAEYESTYILSSVIGWKWDPSNNSAVDGNFRIFFHKEMHMFFMEEKCVDGSYRYTDLSTLDILVNLME